MVAQHTLHTIDASLAFVAVLINAVFTFVVLFRTSRSGVFLVFFFICIATIIWNLGDFIVYLTGERFWFYFSLIGTGMIPALMLHFISTLVRPEQKISPWITAVYVLSSLLAFGSPLAILDAGVRNFVDGFAWNICYFVLLVPIFLWSIVMVFKTIQKANDDEKNRLRYILLAMIVGFFSGVTDLVQILGVPVPPLGHFGTVVYSSILAVGVFKHRTAYDVLVQMRMKLDVLSEMAAGIAHEIRNPLSSIKGAAKLLEREMRDGGDIGNHEYLDIISDEIERLNNILLNFQYLTKPIRLEKESVSVNEVIEKTVKLTQIDILNLGIRLDLSRNLPMVYADPSCLKQVFLNLIKNAAEACGPGGELMIKTESDSSRVRISFSDNGQGIPPEALDRIFEPFFTTKTSGMGVGLTFSRRIIEAHNGRIEAENLLPKGTRFTILLPV